MENEKREYGNTDEVLFNEPLGSYLDIGKILSFIASVAFLMGWVYDLGYFFSLDFRLLGVLSINDYVLSTVNSLPWIIGLMFLIVSSQYIPQFPKFVSEGISDIKRKRRLIMQQYTFYGFPTIMLAMFYIVAYQHSPSEESTFILVIAGAGSFISFIILMTVRKRYTLSGNRFTLAFFI